MLAWIAIATRPPDRVTPSVASLIDLVGHGEVGPGSNVLYAHLGGQPAINAYAALFAWRRRGRSSTAGSPVDRGPDHPSGIG